MRVREQMPLPTPPSSLMDPPGYFNFADNQKLIPTTIADVHVISKNNATFKYRIGHTDQSIWPGNKL